MTGLDPRLLPSFVVVARVGNVTRAAAELNLTQPALSAQLQRLEAQLGVTLLHRTRSGVELTAAGEALLRRAEEVVALTELATAESRAAAGLDRLRVDVHDEALAVPREILTRLGRMRIPMEVSAIGTSEQDRLLLSGELDLALGGRRRTPLPTPLPTALVETHLVDEPLGVAFARDHPAASAEAVDLAALRDEAFYLPRRSFSPDWNDLVETLCHDAGFSPRIADIATESTRLPMSLVAAGRCVAVSLLSTPVPSTVALVPLQGVADFEWTVRHRRDARHTVYDAVAAMGG
ncbi:LysR family transcriptional regulator [Flexivirga sp. ID2601S]|uniref:LysR family transcriptional regulator n=1 Tax=Flexivirga aerilata TaxID=1656889 RepID=A0A849AGA4_9MICO|nr:LysR family transcriptional regulator [Flexivirga aerilata]